MVKLFGRKNKNSSAFVPYHGRLVFKVFVAFSVLGHIQSKNEVSLLEASLLLKSAKTEVKIVWPTELEMRPPLYLV